MSEPAASHPDPSTTSHDSTVPPMPSEVTNGRTLGSATADRWRTAMTPLRKMMRRTPRDAA